MRKSTEKIGLTFENAALLRAVVGAFAAVEGRSMSTVIERTTLNALLPKNKIMREIAQYQLFGEDGNVGRALSAICERNSAGLNWRANHDNLLPIVEFARSKSIFCTPLLATGDKKAVQFASTHLVSQLESIVDYLRDLAAGTEDASKAAYYQREVQFGEYQLSELKNEPQCYHTMSGYDLIVHNWADLSWSQITYRLLNDLVQLDSGWRSEPEQQLELLQLMKDVSAEWDTDN